MTISIKPARCRRHTAGALMLLAGLATAVAAAEAPPLPDTPLRLPALIARALEQAPQQQIAEQGLNLARAEQDAARAKLLPQLSGRVSQLRETLNPATLGFEFPGLPGLLGPFSVFDARLTLSQKVLDLARSSELTGAGFAVDVAAAQVEQNAEQLASRVALAYIEVLAGEQSLASAQADVDLGERLLMLARDQRSAGIASGVDVARAETALAQDRYALSETRTRIAQSRLQLQRLAVLPMQGEPRLAGQLDAPPSELGVTLDQALNSARSTRAELRAVAAAIQQADAQLQAAHRRRLPTLSLMADYGLSSNTPVQNDRDTYRYGAVLDFPVFAGGALRAEDAAASARLEQQRLQLQDLQQQIEQDVRLSLATLANSAEQVRAARATQDLAAAELELARDRFGNGVANNVDVVTAQANLARARAQAVAASAALQQARLNLAAAQGHARAFDL